MLSRRPALKVSAHHAQRHAVRFLWSGLLVDNCWRARVAYPFQLVQDDVEALALYELHGEEVDAVGLADAEHRDDVGMVQPRCRLRLPAEPVEMTWLQQCMERQHFQGDVAAKRLLNRL